MRTPVLNIFDLSRQSERELRRSKRLILRLKIRSELLSLLDNIIDNREDLAFYGLLLIGLALVYVAVR
jgi:hypothetical protein